ncbi:MAG: TorF family putative porin [Rhodomicrobiaceae bacterium]
MEMKRSVFGVVRASLLGGVAAIALTSAGYAADLGGGMKDMPAAEPERELKFSANGGLTSDYVFRGISQSDENASVSAGVEASYGMFYAGFWGASVDDFVSDGNLELDLYGGIRKSWNGIDLDVGVIYYSYPNNHLDLNPEYVEIKASASGKIWSDLTAKGTVYWSPDYAGESGSTWTFEGTLTKPLPIWDLSLSGSLGYVTSADDNFNFSSVYGDDNYTYWNIGLSKTFREHFTVDLRYWGTNVDDGFDASKLAGNRVVGSLNFTY